ncbi:MAG: glycoside hydrolase family 3 N-terminal domain-containing protein [Planctomycetota bacterium]
MIYRRQQPLIHIFRALVLVLLALPASTVAQRGAPNLTEEQAAFVEQLLAEMTLEEKVGQMMQLTLESISSQTADATQGHVLNERRARKVIVEYKAGSILNTASVAFEPLYWRELVGRLQAMAMKETRLGIPILYGIDSVHGANYVRGATIFPHNLTLAATFEPELARRAAEITATETRSCGMTWNFAPVCDVMRAPAWSRVFETYGEDPHLCAVMARASVLGMQGDSQSSPTAVAATAKHFVGYSDPDTGRDRTPASISPAELSDTFIPPFEAVFDAGVRSVMVNSGEINGVPVHADPRILTQLLREQMGYEGIVVTDWRDILKLVDAHRVAENEKEATYLAVQAGIDVAMTPYSVSFADSLLELVNEGRVAEERLDESVRRMLALKVEQELFDEPIPVQDDTGIVGSSDANSMSLEAARRGITLLRNSNDLLPLAAGSKILVTGPASESVVPLHGAWTYSWQGADERLYPEAPTIYDTLRERFGAENVTYVPGAGFEQDIDVPEAVQAAKLADVVVLCLGETPSAEKPGDISSLILSDPQVTLAQRLLETDTPVVLVLVTNRPRLITAFESQLPAILWAGHPGPHGSTALAEIIAGDINPSGRLPFTYPRYANALIPYDHKFTDALGKNPRSTPGYDPLFHFGAGLGYTTFEYEQLSVSSSGSFPGNGRIDISVQVANTGARPGAEVVQLYVTDEYAAVTPRVRRLKAFDKIELAPGESRTATFVLESSDLLAVDRDGHRFFEPGDFTFSIGRQSETARIGR